MKAISARMRGKAALASTAGILALALTSPAFAQEAPTAVSAPDEIADDAAVEEIVVTGTLLRGIAPVGTNVVTMDAETIQATGATSTNDVLARIPQITSNFNQVAISSTGNGGTTISRPNIRNLGGSGTNTTLVIVDGHRVVGAGVVQTTPDPDIVPPALIERIEVVPDGGSSIYGSDAIGGVINFITRRRYDGVEVSGRYGIADNYWQYDVNATVGKDWGTGSLFASYVFTKHDALFGRERDYVRQIQPSNQCSPGTIILNAGLETQQTFRVADGLPGVAACDALQNASIVPAEHRHSVFAGFNQDLNDAITVDVRAFYTSRITTTFADQFRSTGTIDESNPYFSPIGDETSQTVAFSYAPVFGDSNRYRTKLSEWGVTPTVTADLGGGWQLRTMGNYGRSFTSNRAPILNNAAQTNGLARQPGAPALTPDTAINPYDITLTNPAVLAGLRNREDYAQAKQELANGRVVLDGAAFSLPGGDVRVAVGAEVIWEDYSLAQSSDRAVGDNAALYRGHANRTVKAVFGELAIPIFGAENATPGFESLILSASGRYDHYSDFGGTFNPKVGVTWKPVNWLSLRGNYGTSFNAPSLADTGAALQAIQVLPISFWPGETIFGAPIANLDNPPISGFDPVIVALGGNPNLKPQEADTFSLGFDLSPSFIEGLRLSGTYYNVNFTNQISLAVTPDLYAPGYAAFVTSNPTLEQAQGILGPNPAVLGLYVNDAFGVVPAASLADIFSGPFAPYLLYDLRRNNLGSVKTDGLDFSASYLRPTGFGSINLSLAGNYILNRKVRAVASGPEQNTLATNTSRFNLTAGVGATVGNLSAQANWYHNAGYDLATPFGGQTRVSSFNVVDLFFAYDVKGEGLMSDLSFTLNVNNVFDQDPPFLNSGNGYTNGSTLGRLFQIGVRKKF